MPTGPRIVTGSSTSALLVGSCWSPNATIGATGVSLGGTHVSTSGHDPVFVASIHQAGLCGSLVVTDGCCMLDWFNRD